MELIFCSLSSGSSGNCYYLGNGLHGILIDAGISAGSVRKFLKEMGISMQSLMGIMITHNHTDHVRGLEVFLRKNRLPVFTTAKIKHSLFASGLKILPGTIKEISMKKRFQLAGFEIEAFPVSHDAPETVGYHLCVGDKKVTIATDLGHICQHAAPYLKEANLLVIESNYDEQMLLNGRYPPYLKSRIRSDKGHLGNHQTSAFLAENLNKNHSHICLAHLSQNNNTPALALETLKRKFNERGISQSDLPGISVLNRNKPSQLIRMTA